MRYMGGKSKIRKEVAGFLESIRKPNQSYLEPFVGGAWVLQEMSGKRYGSDANTALIAMYKALQNGWIPPDFVSEEQHKEVRRTREENMNDPLTAFCMFGLSFAGDWNGGYARSGDTNFSAVSKRSLLKQLPQIQDVTFKACSYLALQPKGMLIYCDPPYQSTSAYGATGKFNSNEFWTTMKIWAVDNTVVVSEYAAPKGFTCVKEFQSRLGLRNSKKEHEVRTERLFMVST
jgi:DNA adenine methylase